MAQTVKTRPAKQETQVRSLEWEDLLEKEMAIHSSILAWKTPWTEESGRLQSMGSQSWTKLSDFTFSVIQHQQNPITAKFSYNMLVHAGWVL